MESLKTKILNIVKPEPGDTFDDAIEKLEFLKSIFDDDDDETSAFDQLMEMANAFKEALDDTTEHVIQTTMMIWLRWNLTTGGAEDGSELIFYDE